MRMRNKKNADNRLAICNDYLLDKNDLCGVMPATLFKNPAQVHLEIGCGKGGFVVEMARLHPDINFIAIESNKNVLVLATEKAKNAGLSNLKFILGFANDLGEYFADNGFSKIYLNFSDPWQKNRHEKRRLTYKDFLFLYRKLLVSNGCLQMKTDNIGLFDYSVLSLSENGYNLLSVTYDLHSENDSTNVMTEYESLFSSQGHKICRLVAQPGVK